MKLRPVTAGAVLTFLVACLLSFAWRWVAVDVLPAPLEDHWLAAAIIWFISISLGVWYYFRRSRGRSPK